MTFPVEEFSAALHPVFGFHADHQPGLVVECGISAVHASLQGEVAIGRHVQEVTVVGNVAVKSLAPEVGLRTGVHDQLFTDSLRCDGLIEPRHAGDQFGVGASTKSRLRHGQRPGKGSRLHNKRSAGRVIHRYSPRAELL